MTNEHSKKRATEPAGGRFGVHATGTEPPATTDRGAAAGIVPMSMTEAQRLGLSFEEAKAAQAALEALTLAQCRANIERDELRADAEWQRRGISNGIWRRAEEGNFRPVNRLAARDGGLNPVPRYLKTRSPSKP